MSLAASGGMAGAGGHGGAMMAHNVNGNAVQNLAQQGAGAPPPTMNASASGATGPSSWIGHDIMDKQQKSLSVSKIKAVAHLPLTAIDLYAAQPMVAYFPPRAEDTVESKDKPVLVGRMKATIAIKSTETAHKTVRKWLTQSKPFRALKEDALTTEKEIGAVLIDRPYRWLGLRRLEEAPKLYMSDPAVLTEEKSHAIAEDATLEVGCRWKNSSLDGKSEPSGDDFDRVVAHLRLVTTKKAFTLLPEEATQIMLHQAQAHVASQTKVSDPEDVCQLPAAVAVPAYAMHDAAMEALMDACQAVPGGTGTLLPRSLCAVVGAVSFDRQTHKFATAMMQRVQKVREFKQKSFRSRMGRDMEYEEDTQQWILLGTTPDGVEATGVLLGDYQPMDNPHCPIGNIRMLSNVSFQTHLPRERVGDALQGLHAALERMGLEEGPAGVMLYGNDQDGLVKQWKDATKSLDEDFQKLPLLRSSPEAVVVGAALLGAISHGRVAVAYNDKRASDLKKKNAKIDLAIRSQWVAPVAVGMAFHYKYEESTKTGWTPIKEVFEFDRRVPAGPFDVECKASDCLVHRQGKVDTDDDEAFLKASKDAERSKNIPLREQAALAFRVQVYQKCTRDGEWMPVGDPLEPLVSLDKDEKRIACEDVTLEISLSATGMLSTMLVGERESVVQATKTARWNYIQNAIAIGLAVLFFGGFFVKSWYEEYTMNRDTRRLLAYYRNVLPGTINDGDERTARWLVYKYSGKRDKLWESLEKKYDIPVPLEHEWPEAEEGEEEPEVITFDDDEKTDGASADEATTEDDSSEAEPDL
jgi:hypothetical protein